MILTCPDCATSYFVEDERIPRRGRTVRCSNCGARWRATPDGEVEPEFEPPEPISFEPAPEPSPPAADDLEFVVAPVKAAPAKSARRRPPAALAMALGALMLVAVAVGAAIVMRREIAPRVPGSAELFAFAGFPVDTQGFVLEGVASKAAFEAGRPVLLVTGAVRNTRHASAVSPPIRINLLDRHEKPILSLLARPLNGQVPPGAKRYFAITLPEPPAEARKLEVVFDAKALPPGSAALAQSAPRPLEAYTPAAEDNAAPHE